MNLPLTTRRLALAQLVFCQGCCCGRTDRGRPELPVDRLKQVWNTEKLNQTVQLTISGCLGPCDLTNVAMVLTPEGSTWLGGMAGDAVYETLIDWARACHAAGEIRPLPAELDVNRFDRWPTAVTA